MRKLTIRLRTAEDLRGILPRVHRALLLRTAEDLRGILPRERGPLMRSAREFRGIAGR